MGWHVGYKCPICDKFVTDEDDDIGTYHTECQKVVRKR